MWRPADLPTLYTVNAAIISVGTELVTGQTLDTNAAWLAGQLTRLGIAVREHVTVGDVVVDLGETLRRTFARADVVIVTGGLGPTKDDLTREAIAAATDSALELDAGALAQIEVFFARWQRPMHEANRIQAMIPRGCRFLPNPRGTAPGIGRVGHGALLFALPGVPAEMTAMFAECVEPELRQRAGGAAVETAGLRCFGVSEARLGEALADLMARGRNPDVGTTASGAVLTVRIIGSAGSAVEAKRLVLADGTEVRRRLGPVVFGVGEDTLQDAVARLLTEQRKTVSVAESCTGGMLGQCLTDVPGSSAYFLAGFVAYADRAKTKLLGVPPELIRAHGAVSEEVAASMASACRDAAGTDVALSITGIAGPGGSTHEKPVGLVYIGLADSAAVAVRRLAFGEHLTREEVRDRSCKVALNLLRLRLMGLDDDQPGPIPSVGDGGPR